MITTDDIQARTARAVTAAAAAGRDLGLDVNQSFRKKGGMAKPLKITALVRLKATISLGHVKTLLRDGLKGVPDED
jgi:hypothetical protein